MEGLYRTFFIQRDGRVSWFMWLNHYRYLKASGVDAFLDTTQVENFAANGSTA